MEEKILGDYRVLKQIGVGALGNVFLAEHRFIKKLYALKVLPHSLTEDSGFLERFEREVVKLAALDHPHIVKTHTVSCYEGQYFLVTDALMDVTGESKTLDRYLAERGEPLQEEDILFILRQVAEALDYAHEKGDILHLGLKFNNILVNQGGDRVQIALSDFGMTKMISPGKKVLAAFRGMAEAFAGSSEESLFSMNTPHFLNTYAFLAPEQKKAGATGIQADTYAFGILAYFLIFNQFPEGFFPLPSEIFSEASFDWDGLIKQTLQQHPQRRPAQLTPLLNNKKVRIAPPPSSVESSLLTEEHKGGPLRVQSHQMEREESALKPIITRVAEKIPEGAPSPVLVGPGSVSEQNDINVTEAEEVYASQLSLMLNREPVITHYQLEKRESCMLEPIQTEMAIIRGGTVLRGSNTGNRDEAPRHKITIESFALDIHPVTNAQFVLFLEAMGGEKDPHYNDLIRLKDSRISRSSGRVMIESGYARHPVVGVTWYGAHAYAKWAGKRLPTEAEWEIASYGGYEHFLFPTGEQIEKSQANFFSSDTTPVKSYGPNGFGLYDMAGNVYEWVQDWYGYNYYETSVQEPLNPKGPPQGVYRVLRGGCWKSLQNDLRCAHRHRNNPGTVNSTYGFRCAADVQ